MIMIVSVSSRNVIERNQVLHDVYSSVHWPFVPSQRDSDWIARIRSLGSVVWSARLAPRGGLFEQRPRNPCMFVDCMPCPLLQSGDTASSPSRRVSPASDQSTWPSFPFLLPPPPPTSSPSHFIPLFLPLAFPLPYVPLYLSPTSRLHSPSCTSSHFSLHPP